jgi:restriction endonuclease S subunit
MTIERRFEDLVRNGSLAIGDGYRAKNEELGGDGPIFLRAAYLQDAGFHLDIPDRFIDPNTEKFGAKVSQLGDVVITTKGNSTGRIGRIREAQCGAVYSPHLSYWRSLSPKAIDQSFLYYWAQSSEFLVQLRGMAHGTDMAPYLSLRDQLQLRITLPDILSQKATGDILGALDDKIELNRRMNETLEAMARAIFKDWFVDFGPTRAKMEGRAPYLAPDIWSLFPDRLDDDGKPEGWITSTIGQEVEVLGGSTPSTKEPAFWGGDIAQHGTADHRSGPVTDWLWLAACRNGASLIACPDRLHGDRPDPGCGQSGLHRDDLQQALVQRLRLAMDASKHGDGPSERERIDLPGNQQVKLPTDRTQRPGARTPSGIRQDGQALV